MAKGYLIAQITVTDADRYKDYVARVLPTIQAYGGAFLVRGGASQSFEGTPPGERNVVIEFPNVQAAHDWYASEEYAPVKALRMASSTSVQTIVEGI